jgi:hypothetical protein
MARSSACKNRGLDAQITASDYVSLHTANPGTTGASEATGGSYTRQPCSGKFTAASGGSKTNGSGAITFANLPAGTFSYFGIWDAASGGAFLWGEALTPPKTVDAGDSITIPTSGMTFTGTT